jgi:hypothetical protein
VRIYANKKTNITNITNLDRIYVKKYDRMIYLNKIYPFLFLFF